MGGINSYDTTPSSNTVLNGIGLSDAMVPTNIDNAFRQIMADMRAFANDIGAKAVSTGSANAQSVATDSGITVYNDGQSVAFIAGYTNSGAATLNVDSVGAKAIRKASDTGDIDLDGGEIIAGMPVLVYYSVDANSTSGGWLLANPATSGLDAATLASVIHAASDKTTPVDADELPLIDSEDSDGLKKLTWANLKATAKAYFDTVYTAIGAYAPGGTDVAVADGGTGRSSHTAYAVLCGGTSSTGAQQSIAGVGSSGQVLTSNGANALPTFQDAPGGSTTYGDVGTYIFGYIRNNGITQNSTYSGSSIRPGGSRRTSATAEPADSTGGASVAYGGSGLSGTWRAMGRMNAGSGEDHDRYTLFVRIS